MASEQMGACGCCSPFVAGQGLQRVLAYVKFSGNPPWPVGMTGINQAAPGGPDQPYVYNTLTTTYFYANHPSVTIVDTQDIYGNVTEVVTGTAPPYFFSNEGGYQAPYTNTRVSATEFIFADSAGNSIVYTLSDQYFLTDAIANAITLLNTVALLNPVATYQHDGEGSSNLIHFGYGNEGYPNTYSILWVTWNSTGVPQITVGNPFPDDNGQDVYYAMNGYKQVGSNIMVSKCATLTRAGYVTKTIAALTIDDADYTTTYGAGNGVTEVSVTVSDLTKGAGENEFTPADVDGYGSVRYSQ